MKFNAAMSMLLGLASVFDLPSGPAPVVHRIAGDTKAGRSMVSKRYRSSNVYAHVTNGPRECGRRLRQAKQSYAKGTLRMAKQLRVAIP